MPTRWLFFLVISCALAAAQQQPQPSAPSVATVVAVTQDPLDSKSCVGDKEFRTSITSPFVFNGRLIEQGAQLVGHVQACNRDLAGRQLKVAAVVIDALVLPNGRTLPIFALLQALGPPLPPERVIPTGSDIGYVPTIESHQDTRANGAALRDADVTDTPRWGANDIGTLSNVSSGVLGLKHIDFDITGSGQSLLWVFFSDTDVEIKGGSQLVVRFSIAPPATQVANTQ